MKRFNWVDYTIFGILILAVLLVGMKFLGNAEKQPEVEEIVEVDMDRLSVEFLCRDLDMSTAQAVVEALQGEDLPFKEEMIAPTRLYNSNLILDAEIVDWEIREQEDGTADLFLTIEAEAEFKLGSYAIGNQQIRVGKDYIAKTMTMELNGIINGLTVLED